MNTDIVYRYIHDRTNPRAPYVSGLPAKDIVEWELLANDGWRASIEANIATKRPCWEKVEPKPTKTAKAAKAAVADDAPVEEVVS